jgi:ATP-dependent RNA helicase SUPV3L1/SUV3
VPGASLASGYRPLGFQAVRVDLVERIARGVHDLRMQGGQGRAPFAADPALATSMGVEAGTLARLMAELGFQPARGPAPDDPARWIWRGRPPARALTVAPASDNAFAGLSALLGHG